MNKTGKTVSELGFPEHRDIKEEATMAYFLQVCKENRELLKSCDKHDFSIKLNNDSYECSRCGGEVNKLAKDWYELGLKHGLN